MTFPQGAAVPDGPGVIVVSMFQCGVTKRIQQLDIPAIFQTQTD